MEGNIHVGDRVKVIDSHGPLALPELVGHEGTVVRVDDDGKGPFPIVVQVDGNADGVINGPAFMNPAELEVIEHAHEEVPA